MSVFDELVKTESEKTILSAIFLEPELLKVCILVPANFGVPQHRELFTVFQELDEQGLPIEPTVVFEHLKGVSNYGRVGGISYVMELFTGAFTTSSFDYHQELVLESYKKRKVNDFLYQATQTIQDKTAEEAMRYVIDGVMSLEEQDTAEDNGHIREVLAETYEWMTTDHGDITGAPTGYRELDIMTSGLQRQDLVIIGARPSMGKTAFATNVCLNYAIKKPKERPNGGPVALFSLEMKNRTLALRMISNLGFIDGQNMRNPAHKFNEKDWEKTMNVVGQLGQTPFHMFDKSGVDIAYIRRKLRMMKRLYPGQHVLVVIDYLQLIRGKKSESRTQEISGISRDLKHLARELDMTIIALSQLSRGVEARQDKRPMLSDLRESGQIEQDADLIAFLYRDEYYNADSDMAGIIEILVAKQRNGPTGVVNLAYAKEYSKFVNIAINQSAE